MCLSDFGSLVLQWCFGGESQRLRSVVAILRIVLEETSTLSAPHGLLRKIAEAGLANMVSCV